MNEIRKIHLEFEINAIDELELISRVKKWYNFNKDLNIEFHYNVSKIIRLNTKSNDKLFAPKLLKEIIELDIENYESQKEHFALVVLKEKCNGLINGNLSPYTLWKLINPIENIFNYPKWLGNLYEVLDWCEPNTLKIEFIEDFMIDEAKERVLEINKLINT